MSPQIDSADILAGMKSSGRVRAIRQWKRPERAHRPWLRRRRRGRKAVQLQRATKDRGQRTGDKRQATSDKPDLHLHVHCGGAHSPTSKARSRTHGEVVDESRLSGGRGVEIHGPACFDGVPGRD
jgi:hypothetical protein